MDQSATRSLLIKFHRSGLSRFRFTCIRFPVVFQTNLLYHVTTEGDEGYEFGDKVSLYLIARYPLTNYVSPGIELKLWGFTQGRTQTMTASTQD